MLQTYQKLIIGIMTIFAVILGFWYFFLRDLTENQSVEGLQEALQTAVLANRDQSARIDRGIFVLDKQTFEEGFKSTLLHSKDLGFTNLKAKNIQFTYLIDPEGKTLNSKIKNKNGTTITNDYTNPKSKYIAIKGVRVLIDANNNGVFTDKDDFVATVIVDTKTGDGFIVK